MMMVMKVSTWATRYTFLLQLSFLKTFSLSITVGWRPPLHVQQSNKRTFRFKIFNTIFKSMSLQHFYSCVSLIRIWFLGPCEDKDGWLTVLDWSLHSVSGQCGQSRSLQSRHHQADPGIGNRFHNPILHMLPPSHLRREVPNHLTIDSVIVRTSAVDTKCLKGFSSIYIIPLLIQLYCISSYPSVSVPKLSWS